MLFAVVVVDVVVVGLLYDLSCWWRLCLLYAYVFGSGCLFFRVVV